MAWHFTEWNKQEKKALLAQLDSLDFITGMAIGILVGGMIVGI